MPLYIAIYGGINITMMEHSNNRSTNLDQNSTDGVSEKKAITHKGGKEAFFNVPLYWFRQIVRGNELVKKGVSYMNIITVIQNSEKL